MPRLSAWYVRAALLYLGLGFTLGGLLLANKGVPLQSSLWRLLPAHIEFLLFGWTLQLTFGVAFWISPRWCTQRGDVRPAWAALVMVNVGVWLVVLTGWLEWPTWSLALGRLLESTAVVAFGVHAWPRIKPWVETPV